MVRLPPPAGLVCSSFAVHALIWGTCSPQGWLVCCAKQLGLTRCSGVQWLRACSILVRKELDRAPLSETAAAVIAACVTLEKLLPGSECTMLRHMVIHLAECMRDTERPPWSTAMWPWERMWGKALKQKHQPTYPETTILMAFNKLYIAAFR